MPEMCENLSKKVKFSKIAKKDKMQKKLSPKKSKEKKIYVRVKN